MENEKTVHTVEDEPINDASDTEEQPKEAEIVDTQAENEEESERQQAGEWEAKVSQLETELEEMNNRFLRAQADLDNFRRRTRKEKEEQAKYASLSVIKALLPALDNLERALSASEETADTSEGLVQGVEIVNRQILDILEQEGLKPIQAVGEPFDPTYHDAVMQEESSEHEAGIVIEEFQKGYQFKDRVIRPSMVKVSQ